MQVILSVILGVLGRVFADKAIQWIALKVLLFTLMVVVLPTVLKNFFIWAMEFVNQMVISTLTDTQLQETVISLEGVGAYLAGLMKIPESMAVILSATAIRLSLNFIPFVR